MHCTTSLCSQHILRIFIQELCSSNVPFQDSKVFSISFVAISSSFIKKHCESKSDTLNATHRKVNLTSEVKSIKLQFYNKQVPHNWKHVRPYKNISQFMRNKWVTHITNLINLIEHCSNWCFFKHAVCIIKTCIRCYIGNLQSILGHHMMSDN